MKLTPVNAMLLAAAMFAGYQLVAAPAPTSQSLPTVPPDLIEDGKSTTPTGPSTSGSSSYPLKKGSRGTEVRRLQTHLGVAVDGVFGVQTENALYQRHGVKSVTSATVLAKWISDAQTTPAVPVKTAVVSYSKPDADYLFDLLLAPPPRNGSGMAYYPRTTNPEAIMVAIPARLAHYSTAQLLSLKKGYAERHAAKKRNNVNGSLYADIVAAVPTAKWTTLFAAFMSKYSSAK